VVVAVGLNQSQAHRQPVSADIASRVWTETADRSFNKTNRQKTSDARH
jgi:hypothetical protein